ncbi:unnamed protein product [Brassica rapa subsp. trilocularis]
MHMYVWHDTINGVNCSTYSIHAMDNNSSNLHVNTSSYVYSYLNVIIYWIKPRRFS